MSILAVGYQLSTEELRGVFESNNIESSYPTITAGVWYCEKCKGNNDAFMSEKGLRGWFELKKMKQIDKIYVKKIHANKKRTLVVGECYSDGDIFYVFFINDINASTTHMKKLISSSDPKNSGIEVIEFERVTLPCLPYIHYLENGKNILKYE